jgi:N-acetylmuramoyl-L-alanine amidase
VALAAKPDAAATGAVRRALRTPGVRLAGLLIALSGAPAAGETIRANLSSGERAALVDRRDLFLEATPLPAEGMLAFCRRLTGDTRGCPEISKLNRNPKRLLAGVRYRVPYPLLTADRKLGVIRAIFPDDAGKVEGWQHRSRGEDLSRVALWFTGDAGAAAALRKANGRKDDRPKSGDTVRVPAELLLPIFRVPEPPAPIAAPPAAAAPAPRLEYGEDGLGKFAIYRLRGGEALYSAVVVRFTGRVHAEDVNSVASEIALRSGIVDVTDIPIGYPVKIPLDLLEPQFLAPEDPRRLEWEVEQAIAERFTNEVEARGLEGVTVLLDPGHGGADVGASMAGVWESNYVYDVALRAKRILENRTRARVEMTSRDGEGFVIVDRDVLPYSRGHRVMTDPPYAIGDSRTGTHLRWYLANSRYRRAAAAGGRDKIVFVSVHADSLHPSLRGASVYVPDVALTAGTFGKGGTVFEQRREYREQPRVSLSLEARQKSEGLSRDLAGKILDGFRARRLAVHPYQPVRDVIYRGRRAWVPAVLRYNEIPPRILLEVCNLANAEDRRLLQTRDFREKVAEAMVDGIRAFFGEKP